MAGITDRIPLRWLSDDQVVAELRRYANQSRDFSPAAADRYDALADRVEYLRKIADAAERTRDEALADVAKVQANIDAVTQSIMSEREGRSG